MDGIDLYIQNLGSSFLLPSDTCYPVGHMHPKPPSLHTILTYGSPLDSIWRAHMFVGALNKSVLGSRSGK